MCARVRVCVACSADEKSGDNTLLSVSGEKRRLAVDAELRHHRSQQPLVSASLRRLRHLRHQVIINFICAGELVWLLAHSTAVDLVISQAGGGEGRGSMVSADECGKYR